MEESVVVIRDVAEGSTVTLSHSVLQTQGSGYCVSHWDKSTDRTDETTSEQA